MCRSYGSGRSTVPLVMYGSCTYEVGAGWCTGVGTGLLWSTAWSSAGCCTGMKQSWMYERAVYHYGTVEEDEVEGVRV